MNNLNHHIIHAEKCEIGDIILRSDKILMFKPFEGITTCNVKNLEEMYTVFMGITKGVPHLYYSDNSNATKFGPEEKAYVTKGFHHFAKACAIKENSALVRFMTHSYLYLHKPQLPMKMFKSEEDSINWLKSLEL